MITNFLEDDTRAEHLAGHELILPSPNRAVSLDGPRPSLIRRFLNLFGEHNFAEQAVDLKPSRDQAIKLMKIAVGAAERLNGRSFTMRHGPALHLDDDEIVTVICDTVHILSLAEKVRQALENPRLPSHTRPDTQ